MNKRRMHTRVSCSLALASLAALLSTVPVHAARDECLTSLQAYDQGGDRRASSLVDDPLFPSQWGLQQINAPAAWKQGALGRGALIAIIDTGVDLSHPDLKPNLVRGTDLAGEATGTDCPGPQDRNGHGTHVAGIAAAAGDNGIGTIGVAPRAQIMPVRSTRGDEDETEILQATKQVAAGIRYAADQGADVINLSVSTFYVTDNPLSGVGDAVKYAWEKGAVIVAAAGNEGDPLCKYPASDPLVICVASTNRHGDLANSTNAPAKTMDDKAVLAPGGEYLGDRDFCDRGTLVLSTFLTRDEFECGISGYATLWGTSMATPHVAGVAALLSSLGLDNDDIVDCILETASNKGTYNSSTGYGIVNAGKAVRDCP